MKLARIMVPTDFSESSFAALRYVVDCFGEHNPEIVLPHVVEPLPYGAARWSDPTQILEHYAETAKAELQRFETEARQLYPNCRAELHFGVVHEVLEELITKLKVDLVVISAHGQSKLIDLLIGTTADRILRYVSCPVLRIRSSGHTSQESQEPAE